MIIDANFDRIYSYLLTKKRITYIISYPFVQYTLLQGLARSEINLSHTQV